MYEGKNIHYSPFDHKPLCSFSTKVCKQRRLNGYAFCVRHILEDPTAPFKQCLHCTHSKQKCTNAIPKDEERVYCNNHMQMLGMIPKKDRRSKRERDREKAEHANITDSKMSLQDRLKTKFNLTQKDERANANFASILDDPYAFPDEPAPPPAKVTISTPTTPVTPEIVAPPPVVARSPVSIGNKSPMSARSPGGIRCAQTGGKSPVHGRPPEHVSAAKLYPELAEKLHMERSKSRLDSKSKFGPRSSRTVNQLETKIAQNKIKMKKNQEGHHGDIQSPLDNQSASSSPKILPMFSPQPRTNPPQFPVATNAHLSLLNQMRQTLTAGCNPPPYGTSNSSVPIPRVPTHPHPYLHSYPQAPSTSTASQKIKREPKTLPDVQLPAFSPLDPKQNFTKVRLRKPRKVLPEVEARAKLKRDSSVQVYGYYAKRQLYNSDLVPYGLDSSDSDDDSDIDALPWQRVWFTASSDEEMDSDDSHEDSLPIKRTTRLALMRARLRRRLVQLRRNHNTNASLQHYHRKISETLLDAVRESPQATVAAILAMKEKEDQEQPESKKARPSIDKRRCLHKVDEKVCGRRTLPYANQCRRHIMDNVDQQLFDYCTARCPDNIQCCDPVFDIRHDFPLCAKHAAKADLEASQGSLHKLKKPRKKTKPSALTRPPKRGKKKRNQKKQVRPQNPFTEPCGDMDMPASDGDVDVESSENMTEDMGVDSPEIPSPPSPLSISQPVTTSSSLSSIPAAINPAVEKIARDLAKLDNLTLPNELSPTIEKSLDLDQATKLLEDHDINEVLNKLPDEAFDIFTGKNGEYNIPTHEETEELERALAAVSETVNRTKESLGKMGLIDDTSDDDELSKHIADTILNQPLHSDHLGTFGEDNLQDLANSISENDLKTMSQVLTNSALSSALGVEELKSHVVDSMAPMTSAPITQPVALALDHTQVQGLLQGHIQTQGQIHGQLAQGQVVQIPGQVNTAYGIIMNGSYGTANYPTLIQTSYQSPATHTTLPRTFAPNVTINPSLMNNSVPLQLNPDVLTSQIHATVERLSSPMQMHSSPVTTPSPLHSPALNPRNPWTTAERLPTTTFQNGYPLQFAHASSVSNGGPKLTLSLPQMVQHGDIVRTPPVTSQRSPFDSNPRTNDAIFQVAVTLPLTQPYTVNNVTTQVQPKS